MPYRPRELVVRAREAAVMLLGTLERDEMVARFLDIYAAEFCRPGRADQPVRYREQFNTIQREAILAMVLRVQAAVPTRLKVRVSVRGASRGMSRAVGHRGKLKNGKKAKGMKRKTKQASWDLAIPLLDLFREEFFVALGRALDWNEDDANEFWHDLELYEQLATRAPQRRAGRASRAIASGPFVDRVGLLLDPSLMDQARRAAGKFEGELNGATDRVLRKVFSRRRAN
jgi:hypothetical protein